MEQGVIMPRVCGPHEERPPQTERLQLRELVPGDVDALFDLLGDPVAMRYFPKVYSRDEASLWIERNQQRYRIFGYGEWAVAHRQTGEMLGGCGPCWHEINDELELEVGYHFRRRYWGRGYATEAALAVLDWCFVNVNVDHVISLIRPENDPSRKVAERNGLVPQGKTVWRGYEHLIYKMEKAQWEFARRNHDET
jgi:[ribosomal protein S5]-alanine N-acetyltransferase